MNMCLSNCLVVHIILHSMNNVRRADLISLCSCDVLTQRGFEMLANKTHDIVK